MDATCSHCVLPPMRNPVSSRCFTCAPATRSRTVAAKSRERFGASPAHSRDRRGGHFDAEEIGHQCGQTVLGQQLVVQRIVAKAVILAPYCTGALTPSGNGARVFAPQAVHWQSCARCSVTTKRLRLGQIKYLTDAMADARFRVEAHTTHSHRGIIVDDDVRMSDLSQGLAFVTHLPARLLCRNVRANFSPAPASSAHRSTAACRCFDSEEYDNSRYKAGATWVMNSSTAGNLAKLKDSAIHPLWQPAWRKVRRRC